jgi:hypothetical protein
MIVRPPTARLRVPSHRVGSFGRQRTDGGDDRESFQPRRPATVVLYRLAAVPLPLALWAAGALPSATALVVAGVLAVFAFARGGFEAVERRRDRRLGELLLRTNPRRPPPSPIAAWRAAELTSVRRRHRLQASVRQLRRETEACTSVLAAPVDAAAVAESIDLLTQLERRLGSSAVPIEPLGMIQARALTLEALGDSSPLYYPHRARDLRATLSEALAALGPA